MQVKFGAMEIVADASGMLCFKTGIVVWEWHWKPIVIDANRNGTKQGHRLKQSSREAKLHMSNLS